MIVFSGDDARARRARTARRGARGWFAVALLASLTLSACSANRAFRQGEQAELNRNYDEAVVAYTRAVQDDPGNREARLALERAQLRAAQAHYLTGRRHAQQSRWQDAYAEFQIANELNPAMGDLQRALREARLAAEQEWEAREAGRTELEALIERTWDAAPPGLDLPRDAELPDSVVFRNASARAVFTALGRLAEVNMVFDPQFVDSVIPSIDLRGTTFDIALTSLASSTQNFFRVTAPRTVTIIPDTPTKRRDYEEEIVRTFYLSNADVSETIDLLRLVIDLRRIAPVTATNAIAIKDTPERIDAAARLLRVIDKSGAEVVIEVQLLEADRQALREYGLQFATAAADAGFSSALAPLTDEAGGLTLNEIQRLSGSDLYVTSIPALFMRLIERDTRTRTLANPHLRTADGMAAEAHFGERVPVPVTTFTPLAAGGVQAQPVTSFNYENIGVNIEITPRVHHNDEVSLTLTVDVSNISGAGFNDLPQFGSRTITTTIRLRDGETNILAGLIRDDERRTMEGLPGFNRIPVLGRIFGRNQVETQQTDIILTLTPHIIRSIDLEENDLRPFRVGRDSATAGGGVGGGGATAQGLPQPQPRAPAPIRQQPITPPVPQAR